MINNIYLNDSRDTAGGGGSGVSRISFPDGLTIANQ